MYRSRGVPVGAASSVRIDGSLRFCVCLSVILALSTLAPRQTVAQEHGIGATKGCADKCVGDLMDCTMTAIFLDDFPEDVIQLRDAWDTVHAAAGDVCIPAVGNESPAVCASPVGSLQIFSLTLSDGVTLSNAVCTDDGGVCNPLTGANCKLPCFLGAPGMSGGGKLPGAPFAGRVRFRQADYVVQPEDAPDLGDTIRFRWTDGCQSGATNCPLQALVTPGGSNTDISPCCGNGFLEDGESCDPPGEPAGPNGNVCRDDCSVCGDGAVDSGESCDDGNTSDTDACRNDCTRCGDGVVNGDEECDDGNTNNLDNCRNDCTLPVCGDNITDAGETCDGTDDAICNTDCRPAGGDAECTCCGDGAVNGGEFCDDGNDSNLDDCRNDCTACGDGIVNGNEECDDGDDDNLDECRNDCTLPECGDNIADPGETCDGTDDATCNGDCRPAGGAAECTCCGDGTVNGGEFCDDGDTDNTDACRNDCTACGDGIVNGDEECDDGNADNLDECRNDCTLPVCGDNITDSFNDETCDGTDDATCNGDCRAAGGDAECTCCGDGTVNGGEFCDDGDTDDGDVCRNDCTACGDGIINGDEECDAAATGDCPGGCNSDCTCRLVCGDGIVTPPETCDGKVADNCNLGQECRQDCTCCGDGIINGDEDCDDGNDADGDGCSAACEGEVTGCRVTGGGNNDSAPWPWDGTFGQGKTRKRGGSVDRYTFGGQAGAPTGAQPQPFGEWTHVQHSGPDGKFTFHAGTASAPEGTEIDRISCCDSDNCVQARPAPAKQIDFVGRGTFKNIGPHSPVLDYATVQTSLHWFEVNIDDMGEPGNKAEPDAICPPSGFTCDDDPGGFTKCACADFYRIKIYSKPDPPSVDRTSVPIYGVEGYITGGNFQIHPPLD